MLKVKKLNEFPEATTYNPEDLLYVVQDGVSKRITRDTLFHGKTLPIATDYNSGDLLYVMQGGVLKTITLDILAGNLPPIEISQPISSGELLSLNGTSDSDQLNSISTFNGTGEVIGPKARILLDPGWKYAGMLKIKINGVDYWQPYYDTDVYSLNRQWYLGGGLIDSSDVYAAYNAKFANSYQDSLINLSSRGSSLNLYCPFTPPSWNFSTGWEAFNADHRLRTSQFETYYDWTMICKFHGPIGNSWITPVISIRNGNDDYGFSLDARHDTAEGGPYAVAYGDYEYNQHIEIQPPLESGVLALTFSWNGGSSGDLYGYRNGLSDFTGPYVFSNFFTHTPFIQFFSSYASTVGIEAGACYQRVLTPTEILAVFNELINNF